MEQMICWHLNRKDKNTTFYSKRLYRLKRKLTQNKIVREEFFFDLLQFFNNAGKIHDYYLWFMNICVRIKKSQSC